jgi:hypothetical protein
MRKKELAMLMIATSMVLPQYSIMTFAQENQVEQVEIQKNVEEKNEEQENAEQGSKEQENAEQKTDRYENESDDELVQTGNIEFMTVSENITTQVITVWPTLAVQ